LNAAEAKSLVNSWRRGGRTCCGWAEHAKQEKFMAEYLPKLDVTLMVGVGAAFDFHSGRTKQAPRWMQRSGLEWFYRLCSEPRRLAPLPAKQPVVCAEISGATGRLEKISQPVILGVTTEMPAAMPPADVIITSRRDINDETGTLADFPARAHHMPTTSFMAFPAWQR